MTTQQMHYFLEAARCLNFTKAAQNLYITQPTLSKQIASLEDELGFKLFQRHRHRVSLTSAGIIMRSELGKIEESLKLTLDHAQRVGKGSEGHLSIALLDLIDPLPKIFPVIERFQEKYPKVDVEIVVAGFREIRQRLTERRIDVVADKMFELRTIGNLNTLPVTAVTGAFLVPADHPLALEESISVAQLKDDSFIILELDECPNHMQSLIELCIKEGFYPRIAKYANSNTAKIYYVHQGYGVALFDLEMPLPAWAKVKPIPMANVPHSVNNDPDIYFGWDRDNGNPAVHLFVETATEYLLEEKHQ